MPLPATFEELQANGGVMLYLPRLQHRANHSMARLREVGFHHIVLEPGVDGHKDDPRAKGERQGLLFDPGLSVGEIGCALSMIRLWQKVVYEGLPYLLVFEDDVLPHPDVGRLGPHYWAETPGQADFIFLGNQMVVDTIDDPSRRVVAAPSFCLHAYVVTQDGARRALALLHEQLSSEDRWLSPIDVEARRWMALSAIRYWCWNGTMLPPPYPISDKLRDRDDLGSDVVRSSHNTGLFFQNLALGSAIWPGHRPVLPSGTGLQPDSAGLLPNSASMLPTGAGPRGRQPEAVLIVPIVPSNRGNGLAMRAGVALEGLAWSFDVTLVVVPLNGGIVGQWVEERAARTLVLPEGVTDPFLRKLSRMTTPGDRRRARLVYPRPVAATWATPQAAAAISEFVDGRADLVYILRGYLAPLAEPWLARDGPPRVVVDVDEDDPRSLRQLADLYRRAGASGRAEMAAADADKLDAIVNEWAGRADLVLAASADEIARFRGRFPAVALRVLPNPVPARFDDGTAEPVDLLFVANFGYLPNEDAARWLCREVLPVLRSRLGAVRVALAGSSMGASVLALEDTDVRVIRCPISVTPLYEATTIAVAPLRAGGGTRLKILEAFGHRRAVVATSRGAEGLPVQSGTHLLIADDAEGFAAACARALTDPDLRRALVKAGVEVAIAHSWSRVAATVSEIALSVVAGAPCRTTGGHD